MRVVGAAADPAAPLIRKAAFQNLVSSIALSIDRENGASFEGRAVDALRELAESYMVSLFGDAGLVASSDGRDTLTRADLLRAKTLRRDAARAQVERVKTQIHQI